MPEEEWRQAARYRGEQDDLEAEARRLVALTREDWQRRETLKRRLQARLEGYVPVGDWLEQADNDREQRNGHRTYPESWAELAQIARQIPRPKMGRPRREGHYDKDPELKSPARYLGNGPGLRACLPGGALAVARMAHATALGTALAVVGFRAVPGSLLFRLVVQFGTLVGRNSGALCHGYLLVLGRCLACLAELLEPVVCAARLVPLAKLQAQRGCREPRSGYGLVVILADALEHSAENCQRSA